MGHFHLANLVLKYHLQIRSLQCEEKGVEKNEGALKEPQRALKKLH